ncbi:putative hydrolase isoform 2 [Tripterygium wilfordii]|uniref:Putative hydrolase isoform 2 n=1 Tax=Tripterygium wilfordii TaxID=458696 RepID=A0A7J7DGX9_TRIWF|nr:putative hydrolase isoform 2 [Tripterygium wilfordii]
MKGSLHHFWHYIEEFENLRHNIETGVRFLHEYSIKQPHTKNDDNKPQTKNFKVMKKTHYYLVDTSVITPGAAVSELQFNVINEEPFVVHNLQFTPLPVWRGRGYRSLGFRFGNVCYISDVSEIPEETYPLLKDCDILILDALRPDQSSSTHFGLPRVRLGFWFWVSSTM